MENAADTLPLGVNPGAPAGFGVGCGMLVRDGGVSGAPKVAPVAADGLESEGPVPVFAARGFSVVAGVGADSFITDGVNFGENGGVRWRTGAGDWLGGEVGATFGGTGAGRCGATGTGAGGGAARGIGGGQAFVGAGATGVFARVMMGFTPLGVAPTPACAGAPAES